jgi:hypothetical protein
MCIFCVDDDGPFYRRKSSAFPRRMVAEAVELSSAAPGGETRVAPPSQTPVETSDSPGPTGESRAAAE